MAVEKDGGPTARAWQIASFGIDSLEVVERPTPQPGPGEVLVGVRSVSYNYRDLLVIQGHYNPKMKLPRIPCSDGAGEVVAVGEGVTAWKPGDRVAGVFMQNWLDGALTPARASGALGGDVDGRVLKQIGGAGVDLVVDVGGMGTLPRSLRAIRVGGTVAQTGVLAKETEPLPLAVILHKMARVQGIYVGSRKDFAEMNKAISQSRLRPVSEIFQWTQAREVLQRMEEGSHFGKLVLTVA